MVFSYDSAIVHLHILLAVCEASLLNTSKYSVREVITMRNFYIMIASFSCQQKENPWSTLREPGSKNFSKDIFFNFGIILWYFLNKNICIQVGREISAIILTDDYLCYKETKSPYNFFSYFWYLTNYLCLKLRTNCNIERWAALLCSGRISTSCLRSHTDPFTFFA